MHETKLWRRVTTALILAVGTAALWATLFTWGWDVAARQRNVGGANGVYEELALLADGTAVIAARSAVRYDDVSYRTLDGRPIEADSTKLLSDSWLSAPYRTPIIYDPPVGWGGLLGASDYGRPAGAWYLIRDDKPHGRAYFMGFDELSRRRIGYIGRKGFRATLPPNEEWFDVGFDPQGWRIRVAASTGYLTQDQRPYHQAAMPLAEAIPPWLVFLIDGDRLLEIDLRERTATERLTGDNLVSVAIVREPYETANIPPARENGTGEGHYRQRVAVRSNDLIRLGLHTDEGVTWSELPIPEDLRDKDLTIFSPGNGRLVAGWREMAEVQQNTVNLVWIDADGTIEREEQVVLAGYSAGDPRRAALAMAAGAPVPIVWGIVGGILGPISMLQHQQADTYGGAIRAVLSQGWLGLLVVFLVGCLMAWLAWRLQRKYYRPATGVWCGFVFLLGVPGFIAYLLEMQRAPLEACPECGGVVPRDREACARCEAMFPGPAPIGTEIFA